MAKSAKPTFIPEWARNDTTDPVLGTANVVEPSEAKKDSGWDPYEKPPRNWMNWLQRGAHLWIDYFNQFFTATHQLKVDEIIEETSAAGVTIDGLTIKDGGFAEDLYIRPGANVVRLYLQTTGSGSGAFDGLRIVLSDSGYAHINLSEAAYLALLTNAVERLRLAASTPQITVANNTRDLVNTSGYVVADKQRETGAASGVLNTKIIEIGDWNMDSAATRGVVHELTFSKIRNVSVYIRNDSNDESLNLLNSGKIRYNSSIVSMERTLSGDFDSTNYDSTSYNRGWITIEYVD